ncbi:MAG: epoxyqueuosine reductase [Anaerolineales bacterium]|nr:epoxyqueuosine reductase [Anaerolineales bacterium]
MDIASFIESIPETFNVNYVGTAKLESAHDFIRDQGGEFIARFPCSISIGIVLPNAIVDLLPNQSDMGVRISYNHHAYNIVNQRLDLATSQIAGIIQDAGYLAYPIPASRAPRDERLCGLFSHKLAAHLSGLGWIGKSCLLVTPDHGPRVRWGTILTDAPLKPSRELLEDRCGDCTQCVDICPVHAFTGKHFIPEEPRGVRYRADVCDRYFQSMVDKGDVRVCGLCLYVCPYGRSNQKDEY